MEYGSALAFLEVKASFQAFRAHFVAVKRRSIIKCRLKMHVALLKNNHLRSIAIDAQ